MLHIQKLDPSDYDKILLGWWKDWGWTAPTKDFLPDNGEGGFIVFDDDTPICAGFVYVTNSKASWVDWIISSKTYNKKPERREAIKMLIDALTRLCESVGSKYCYALIKHQSLIKIYEEIGYNKADSYNLEMIKKF